MTDIVQRKKIRDAGDAPERPTIRVSGIGWVLPSGVGRGAGFFDLDLMQEERGPDAGTLAGFSAKPYLHSVKGYLDPAGAYVLAAASLALGETDAAAGSDVRDDAGVVSLTVYGALTSQYRFLQQLAEKGPRLASPLVFPHGYSNTAGNLLAIELGFGGMHLVQYGDASWPRALATAVAALGDGSVREMIVTGYEAVHRAAVPPDIDVVNGAVALHLSTDSEQGAVGFIDQVRLQQVVATEEDPTAGAIAAAERLVREGILKPLHG